MNSKESVGDGYPGRESLPLAVGQFYDRLWMDANGAAQGLAEGWQRSVRHNLGWERRALWHSLHLGTACARAVDDRWLRAFPVSAEYANAETRYKIEAAIRLIPDVVPFSAEERTRLLGSGGERHAELWMASANNRESELVSCWHRWLWEADGQKGTDDHGRASVLECACLSLVTELSVVLGEDT